MARVFMGPCRQVAEKGIGSLKSFSSWCYVRCYLGPANTRVEVLRLLVPRTLCPELYSGAYILRGGHLS